MKKLIVLAALVAISSRVQAAFIDDPTTMWTEITYGTNVPDFPNDQQTGLTPGDIVGDVDHPAFYKRFNDAGTPSLTDGALAFRVRLNSAKNYKKMAFDYTLFVGIDADQNGSLDLFVGVDNSPNGATQLAIWNPGTGANTGPSTTTIVSPPVMTYAETIGANYHFDLVSPELDPAATSLDVDGGGNTDVFLSFSVEFADIVSVLGGKGINIDQNSPVNYVMATSTQNNSLNMDLNGVEGGVDSTLTFTELGVTSDTFSLSGAAVPEATVTSLIGMAGILTLIGRRLFFPS